MSTLSCISGCVELLAVMYCCSVQVRLIWVHRVSWWQHSRRCCEWQTWFYTFHCRHWSNINRQLSDWLSLQRLDKSHYIALWCSALVQSVIEGLDATTELASLAVLSHKILHVKEIIGFLLDLLRCAVPFLWYTKLGPYKGSASQQVIIW